MQFVRLLHSLQGVSADKLPGGMLLVDHRENFVVDHVEQFIEVTLPPPEPPTDHYFQITNTGVDTLSLTIDSRTAGNIFIDDTFVSKLTTNPTIITIEPASVLKLTGATPKATADTPLIDAVSGSFSLDRFDESVTNYSYAFYGCDALTEIDSWNNVSNATSFSHAFESTGLVSIPDSWSGLDNLTDATAMFADCTELVDGGNSDADTLSRLTDVTDMFKNCIEWEGDSYTMYRHLRTLEIGETLVFLNCSSSTGYANIPTPYGGLYHPSTYFQFVSSTGISLTLENNGDAMYEVDGAWHMLDQGHISFFYLSMGKTYKFGDLVKKAYPSTYDTLITLYYNERNRRLTIEKFDSRFTSFTNIFGRSNSFILSDVVKGNQIEVASWDGAENCTSIRGLFCNYEVSSLPSDWSKLSKVEDMAYAFAACHNLAILPTTNFDMLTRLTDVTCAFASCLSISNDTSAIHNHILSLNLPFQKHGGCFYSCENMPNWNNITPEYGGPYTSAFIVANTVASGVNSTLYVNGTSFVSSTPGRYAKIHSTTPSGYRNMISSEFVGFDGGMLLYISNLVRTSTNSSVLRNTSRGIIMQFDSTWTSIRYAFTQGVCRVDSWDGAENISNCYSAFSGNTDLTSIATPTTAFTNAQEPLNLESMFENCYNVETGIYAMYTYLSSLPNVGNHSRCFRNCGMDTTAGAAELAQIPSDWK